jgi:hypothetical protein
MPGPQEARFAAAALTGFLVMAATQDRDFFISCRRRGLWRDGVRPMAAAAVLAGILSSSLSGPAQS